MPEVSRGAEDLARHIYCPCRLLGLLPPRACPTLHVLDCLPLFAPAQTDCARRNILSEVEGGLEGAPQAPRPLADALRSAVATGAALLRALRPSQ